MLFSQSSWEHSFSVNEAHVHCQEPHQALGHTDKFRPCFQPLMKNGRETNNPNIVCSALRQLPDSLLLDPNC